MSEPVNEQPWAAPEEGPQVIELRSADGAPYATADEAEAAHLHRALGYRFVHSADRDRILPNH